MSDSQQNIGNVKPDAKILRVWSQADTWSPEDGLALAFGLDPAEERSSNSLMPPGSLIRKIRKDTESGLLSDIVTPAMMIEWCRPEKVEFHPDWHRALFGSDEEAAKRQLVRARHALQQRFQYLQKRDKLIKQWALSPYWKIAYGIALVHNLDPEVTVKASMYGFHYIADHEDAGRLLRQAQSAEQNGDIASEMHPAEFLEWAPTIGIEIDPAWIHAMPDGSLQPNGTLNQIGDYPLSYPGGFTQVDYEHDPQLQASPEPTIAKREDISTKERDSLLKLVIGMAVAGYKFDPKKDRNEATGDIASDLERLGIGLNRDTILKWLREGAELLPGDLDGE